eukprot:3018724-Prymnesium_polylepis.2
MCTLGKRWDRYRQPPLNSNEGGAWDRRHAATPPGIEGWQVRRATTHRRAITHHMPHRYRYPHHPCPYPCPSLPLDSLSLP